MTVTRIFSVLFSATLLITVFSSDASAQIFARSKQRFLRLIGQGFGDGYHLDNPGPNSDYYNPYSVYNSTLVDPVLREKYFGHPIQQFEQPTIPYPPALPTRTQVFPNQTTPYNPNLGGGDFDPTAFQVPAQQPPMPTQPKAAAESKGSAKKQPATRKPEPRKPGSGSKGSAAKKTSVALPAGDNDFQAFNFPVFDDN